MPKLREFDYSFANFAEVIDTFLTRKNVKSYVLYAMDYGAPVGYRLSALSDRQPRDRNSPHHRRTASRASSR